VGTSSFEELSVKAKKKGELEYELLVFGSDQHLSGEILEQRKAMTV
jgi:hypothetical protein